MEKGKEYTIADDKGPHELLIYEKEGVFISEAYSETANRKNKIFTKASYLIQSKKGDLIVAASEKKVMVYSLKDKSPIAEKEFNYIHSISLSPCETYLQILDKITVNEGKTLLFSLPDMTERAVYSESHTTGYFNKQYFPLIRFSADDSHYFRYNSKVIEVYDSKHTKIS